MSSLLILGGSNCQINAFRRARERGVNTILFDYLDAPPAAALADRHVRVSTFDVEGCLREAAKLRPGGVMTLGTDQPVYTAAVIAEKLGLPHLIDTQTALAVTDKSVMKRRFDEYGIPRAPYRLVKKEQLQNVRLSFPLVMKPLDSQGQKGVFRVCDKRELEALFDASLGFSRRDTLLLEEYYPGGEVTVSAWCERGAARVLTITDRVSFDDARHIGICASHRFPSRYAAGMEDEIALLTQRLADAFEVMDGPLYIQLLIGGRGIIVNELACRIGGAFEDVFIPLLTGFDILGAVMDAALGADIFSEKRPPLITAGSARVLMLFARPGKVSSFAPLDELLRLPFVADAGYNIAPGHTVPPMENAGERLGHAVLTAEDEREMARNLDLFYKTLYIRDGSGADMLLRRES